MAGISGTGLLGINILGVSLEQSEGGGLALPEISLTGANPLYIGIGRAFQEPGFSASDAEDGDLTASVVESGDINTNVKGTYTRSYDVQDSNLNFAETQQRTIHVLEEVIDVLVPNPNRGNKALTRYPNGTAPSL